MIEFFSSPWNYLGFALVVNILKIGVIIGDPDAEKRPMVALTVSIILCIWLTVILMHRS